MAAVEPRRQRKLHISLELIARLLNVPDDVTVVRLIPRADPDGIDVVMSCDRFDIVEPGAEMPRELSVIGETLEDDEGGPEFLRLLVEV